MFDVQSCIENIETYIGKPQNFIMFSKDMMMQQAVERNLEIIGEAINCILKLDTEIKITDARRMVDTRIKIIHANDNI